MTFTARSANLATIVVWRRHRWFQANRAELVKTGGLATATNVAADPEFLETV